MSEWSKETRNKVQIIYGLCMGGFLTVSGVWFIPDVLRDDEVTRNELILIGGICIVGGLMAALPSIVMQYIGKGVHAWEVRRQKKRNEEEEQ